MNGQEGLDAFKDHENRFSFNGFANAVMDGYETLAIRNGAVGAKYAAYSYLTADVMEGTKLRTTEMG
jgi:hypothetical protein